MQSPGMLSEIENDTIRYVIERMLPLECLVIGSAVLKRHGLISEIPDIDIWCHSDLSRSEWEELITRRLGEPMEFSVGDHKTNVGFYEIEGLVPFDISGSFENFPRKVFLDMCSRGLGDDTTGAKFATITDMYLMKSFRNEEKDRQRIVAYRRFVNDLNTETLIKQ